MTAAWTAAWTAAAAGAVVAVAEAGAGRLAGAVGVAADAASAVKEGAPGPYGEDPAAGLRLAGELPGGGLAAVAVAVVEPGALYPSAGCL